MRSPAPKRVAAICLLIAGVWLPHALAAERFCTTTASPPSIRLPDSSATSFTAIAGSDILRAGPGPGQFARHSWQNGVDPAEKHIFGQVVRIESVTGAGAEAVRRARSRGVRKALVVPWSYQADCSPVPWRGSAQWVPPNTKNFFRHAELRPSEDWVRGLPTFDLPMAKLKPYPHGLYMQSHLMQETGVTQRLRDSIRTTLPFGKRGALQAARATADSLHYQVLLPAKKTRQAAIMDTMDTTRTYSITMGVVSADSSVADTSRLENVNVRLKASHMAWNYVRDSSHARIEARHRALRKQIRQWERTLRQRVYEATQRTPLPSDSLLSAEEYFSLYKAMPYYTNNYEAVSPVEPLRQWEAAHPEAATRYPASRILQSVYERKRHE